MKLFVITVLTFSIIGFGIFAFRGIIFAPVITVLTVQDGMHVPSGVIEVSGTTKRVESLFIQGKQIVRSPQGTFSVEVAVFAPYTIIELEAKDRFNKTIQKQIQLSVE